jgi:hypothetical protein
MLVVLRMNRTFMEYMRINYGHIAHQEFQQTVVDADNADVLQYATFQEKTKSSSLSKSSLDKAIVK